MVDNMAHHMHLRSHVVSQAFCLKGVVCKTIQRNPETKVCPGELTMRVGIQHPAKAQLQRVHHSQGPNQCRTHPWIDVAPEMILGDVAMEQLGIKLRVVGPKNLRWKPLSLWGFCLTYCFGIYLRLQKTYVKSNEVSQHRLREGRRLCRGIQCCCQGQLVLCLTPTEGLNNSGNSSASMVHVVNQTPTANSLDQTVFLPALL